MKQVTISRRWLLVALLALLAVAVSGAALSAELADDDIYMVAEGEVVDDDLYIVATEIYINGTVRGDLFAGAQYIEIGPTGTVEGDLWAAATSIVIDGAVLDDLRAAGAGIELAGIVGDDAFLAAGGQANVPTPTGAPSIAQGLRISGEIGGDAFVAAGSADISGTVGGDFAGGVGTLDLTGVIEGDAQIQTEELRVSDASRIGGALKYSAPAPLQLPAGVARDIQFDEQAAAEIAQRSIASRIVGWILRTVAILVGVAIVGWLLLRIRPNALVTPAAAIRANPVQTGLFGLIAAVLLIFIPIASIVLVAFTATFWGVVPAIAMFIFLVASSVLVWFLSPLFTGMWLGEQINERLGGDRPSLQILLLGALLIVILGRVPILGWFVYLLSFVLALGGLLRSGTGTAAGNGPEEAVAG